jgi:hypothetical protein
MQRKLNTYLYFFTKMEDIHSLMTANKSSENVADLEITVKIKTALINKLRTD